MEKLPISLENARTIIKDALRRGPIYVFEDEADAAAKESVRALLAHWPDVFRDADDKSSQPRSRTGQSSSTIRIARRRGSSSTAASWMTLTSPACRLLARR